MGCWGEGARGRRGPRGGAQREHAELDGFGCEEMAMVGRREDRRTYKDFIVRVGEVEVEVVRVAIRHGGGAGASVLCVVRCVKSYNVSFHFD